MSSTPYLLYCKKLNLARTEIKSQWLVCVTLIISHQCNMYNCMPIMHAKLCDGPHRPGPRPWTVFDLDLGRLCGCADDGGQLFGRVGDLDHLPQSHGLLAHGAPAPCEGQPISTHICRRAVVEETTPLSFAAPTTTPTTTRTNQQLCSFTARAAIQGHQHNSVLVSTNKRHYHCQK